MLKQVLQVASPAGAGARLSVLIFHRVLPQTDPLFPQEIDAARFDAICSWLRRWFDVLPLDAALQRLYEGSLPARACAITFDDGYADNLLAAKPILEARGAPATMFVTAGMVNGDREFWWDELERLLLATDVLPATMTLRTDKGDQPVALAAAARYDDDARRRDAGWSVEQPGFPTPRHMLYRYLQQTVHGLGDDQRRQGVLDAVAAWAGVSRTGRPSHRPLRAEEVAALAGGVTAVGAHTMTHPMLALLPEDAQRREIIDSRRRLEDIVGAAVDLFAYPYGSASSFTPRAVAIVKEAGFAAACSTRQAPVAAGDDLFALPRMTVRDWSAEELERRLTDFRRQAAGG